jgi:cytochrome c556
MTRYTTIIASLFLPLAASVALAGDAPQEQRHELMEDVGGAAKPIGQMMKGERAFEAEVAMQSFETWSEAAARFGDLFPEGSETGYDTEAKSTIWTDRAGFDAKLATFSERVQSAIDAAPADLEALKSAAGPVFKACKDCHESYRVED